MVESPLLDTLVIWMVVPCDNIGGINHHVHLWGRHVLVYSGWKTLSYIVLGRHLYA